MLSERLRLYRHQIAALVEVGAAFDFATRGSSNLLSVGLKVHRRHKCVLITSEADPTKGAFFTSNWSERIVRLVLGLVFAELPFRLTDFTIPDRDISPTDLADGGFHKSRAHAQRNTIVEMGMSQLRALQTCV